MDKFFTATGNIRKDHFGRIVVDTCTSDLDHNRNSKTDPVQNRPLCRRLVEEALDGFIGKKGTLVLTISLKEEAQSALPVSEMSDETTRKVMDTGAAEKKPSMSKSALEMSVVAALEHVDGQ